MRQAGFKSYYARLKKEAESYRAAYAACALIQGGSLFLLFSTVGVLLSRVVGQVSGEYASVSLCTVACYLTGIALMCVLSGYAGVGLTFIEGKIKIRLRQRMLGSYFRADEASAAGLSPEAFLTRVNQDLPKAVGLVGIYINGWIYGPIISGLLSLGWAFLMNPMFGLLCFSCAAVNMLFFKFMSKSILHYTNETVIRKNNVFTFLREYIAGAADIRSLGWQKGFRRRLRSQADLFRENHKKLAFSEAKRRAILTYVADCITMVLLVKVGYHLSVQGYFRFSDVMIAMPLMDQIGQMMMSFSNYNMLIDQLGVNAERVFEVIDLHCEKTDLTMGESDMPDIAFQNVSFSFGDKTVLKDLSFTVRPREKLAIVGESGSGKSTVLKLLAGLYAPDEGNISFGTGNVRDSRAANGHTGFSVLPQAPHLFKTSIAENIALDEEPDMSKVIRCAQAADASGFIEAMPEKYQTAVQENNSGLSGGQVQRIALARCLYPDPCVILLDEPTASIDHESGEKVTANLLELKDKTVVMVSHKLSFARDFDHILVIKDGGLHEEGSHEELMRKGGEYARLWDLQQGGAQASNV